MNILDVELQHSCRYPERIDAECDDSEQHYLNVFNKHFAACAGIFYLVAVNRSEERRVGKECM